VVVGDGGREAYTTIAWGGLLSCESHKIAGAETVSNVEGNMCGAVMRGADALSQSKTPSRANRRRRNLGGLMSGRAASPISTKLVGPHRGGEEP
jgi:hypothetical protein